MFRSQYFSFPPIIIIPSLLHTHLPSTKLLSKERKWATLGNLPTEVILLWTSDSIMKEKYFLCYVSEFTHFKHVFYNSGRLAAPEYRIIPLYPTIYKALQVNWCGKMLSGTLRLPQLSRSVNEAVCFVARTDSSFIYRRHMKLTLRLPMSYIYIWSSW